MMLDFSWISVCSAQACFSSAQFFSFYLPELVPYVSFHSVCLNGPVVVCLGSTWWLSSYCLSGRFLLILVCLTRCTPFLFCKCLPEEATSCLSGSNPMFLSCQCLAWGVQMMSAWIGPMFLFKCLSGVTNWCMSGLNPEFLSVSVCLRVSISVCFSWCPMFLFCKCLSREGPMDVFLDWTQILLSVLGLSAGFNLYLL